MPCKGTVVKTSDLSTRRSQRAQSVRVFQSSLVFSDASALSARSAVKFGGIVISLENLTVPVQALHKGAIDHISKDRLSKDRLGGTIKAALEGTV